MIGVRMIGIIIQARTGSNRFPRKIYQDILGKYTLQRVLEGASSAKLPHKIILAMPEYDFKEFAERQARGDFAAFTDDRFATYFGSPDDLVDRYFQSARKYGIDIIVRVTADCPLIQGKIIDEMLCEYLKNGYNGFMGNNELVSSNPYPDGTDIEIFPYWMLAETWQLTKDPHHREHVTPFMYRRGTQYPIYSFLNQRPNTIIANKGLHFSFDTQEDYELVTRLAKNYDVSGNLDAAVKAIV
jgi:spore coat polysaccharide biosynthesis protein SpsF